MREDGRESKKRILTFGDCSTSGRTIPLKSFLYATSSALLGDSPDYDYLDNQPFEWVIIIFREMCEI